MNPYEVLNIEQGVTKQDILRAVTLAMRERKYSSREIALAQKTLMASVSNASEEFIRFIDVKSLLDQLDMTLPETKDEVFSEIPDADALKYLSISV
ncbi:MAG TPA: hypothetical protein ENK58_05085 [Desulfobacterales bacterium]|nr:hypothetical protein [Desulfobacterales bacterium]